MADLRERGQMILVGGLAVTLGIVVLVLLLNSAIYTQNVATRSGATDAQGALEYRAAMTGAAADLIDAENERPYTAYGPLWRNVTEGVGNVSDALRDQWAERVASARLASLTVHNGTRIVQTNASRDLDDASGTADWTVATGANGVRSFTLTPTSVDEVFLSLGPTDDSTQIIVTGNNSKVWRLYVYKDAGVAHLGVENGSGTTDATACPGFSEGDTVDLVAGTVNGSDCAALSFAAGTTAPWNVTVANGNHTAGTYALTVNTTATPGALAGPSTADSPRWEPLAYSAWLDLRYRSPDLRYGTHVRVTPGEDDA